MEWYPDEDEEDLMFSPALLARRASESWIVEPPVEVNIYFVLFVFRSKLIKGYGLNLIYWLEFPSLQNHQKKNIRVIWMKFNSFLTVYGNLDPLSNLKIDKLDNL